MSTSRSSVLRRITHYYIVAEALCDLGESVGRARGDEDNVSPAAELNVEDCVADLVVGLDRGGYG